MAQSSYKQISSTLLYEGMVVPHDIYDHTLNNKLITQGSVVNASLLERLDAFTKGGRMICVTAETEKVMRMQGLAIEEVVSREDLEEQTGYSEVKYEVLDMLEEIASTGISAVRQTELGSVSRELSRTVDNTEPAVIVELVNALAPVDEYLQRHCINVSLLNGLFGKWLKLPKDTVDTLILVGLLHDCGKASLPNKILSSTRGLTGIEFEVIKTHPMFSTTLLTEFPEEVQLAARGHHEKISGRGYPDGLSGEGIPYMSRITAISDIYDAMTARRTYKNPNSPFVTMSMLNKLKGDELDPELVDAFIGNMPEELIGRPVLLSDNTVGIVHSCDFNDIEHPMVKVGRNIIKTDESIYCLSMYFEEADG